MTYENPLAGDLEHVLDHTRDLWDELRGQRIFITGGTGYVGCWFLESFTWANDKLNLSASATVLTRNPDAFLRKAPHLAQHPAVSLYQGDIRSFEFPQGTYSHLIHAAAESSTRLNEHHPLEMFDVIVEGTRHILEFSTKSGVNKFLFLSTGAVYGPQPSQLNHLPEDYLGGPDTNNRYSAYAEGKRAAELLCTLYAGHSKLQTKVARGFAFVGPYLPLDAHFAIGNFIRDALCGGPIIIKGDGTPFRSYLYAADMAIWLWTILLRGESKRAYNVGSPQSISIAQLAHRVAASFDPVPSVTILAERKPANLPERYVPNVSRCIHELGLDVWIDLDAAIHATKLWSLSQSPLLTALNRA